MYKIQEVRRNMLHVNNNANKYRTYEHSINKYIY